MGRHMERNNLTHSLYAEKRCDWECQAVLAPARCPHHNQPNWGQTRVSNPGDLRHDPRRRGLSVAKAAKAPSTGCRQICSRRRAMRWEVERGCVRSRSGAPFSVGVPDVVGEPPLGNSSPLPAGLVTRTVDPHDRGVARIELRPETWQKLAAAFAPRWTPGERVLDFD